MDAAGSEMAGPKDDTAELHVDRSCKRILEKLQKLFTKDAGQASLARHKTITRGAVGRDRRGEDTMTLYSSQ